ncbi:MULTISPECIES: flagellar brake protein [Luteimonas]|uniref:Flagellar brake protein YcgR n=1 Tax=Luteimonas chenhongjianii TaxID=2006110 RepID=A0A290XF49_9GAMM|nr:MULTISPECIES: flagellar brake protein [Luteimonas]ATD67648.1 pilus assembly protein PilZ [Luteimonas chenhongjianii]RPD88688.1 flagellar brake protein [Luteimonas sp. 100069]
MMPVAEHQPPLQDDDEASPFALHEPREVAQVLRALVEARAIVTASLVPGGHACPTALLAVHDDGTLVLDGNRHEAMNRRMDSATRLVCSTQLDLVPIRFRLPTPTRIDYEGYLAFRAPWPVSLLQLQRRELYRLRVSPAAPATLHVGDGDAPPDAGLGGLRVLDISGGGLAIAVPDGQEGRFRPQSRIAPCLLRLAEAPEFTVALEVAHLGRFDVRGVAHWRVGCRFVDLPAALEQRVLQYIFQVERQRNARQRRGG